MPRTLFTHISHSQNGINEEEKTLVTDTFSAELEDIASQAMKAGKLNVALKAKELLARIKGLLRREPLRNSRSILSQLSDADLVSLMEELQNKHGNPRE